MAYMLVRVELHENSSTDKPSGETYEKLHAKMEAAGFSRKIENKTKTGALEVGSYWLPHAMYASNKFDTATAALLAGWEAAKGLGYNYGIVGAGSNFDGYGLKSAK